MKPEVGTGLVPTKPSRWLTKAEAEEEFPPTAPGMCWDEPEQKWMARGEKFAVDRERQQSQPEVMLAEHDRRREMVLRFVASKMKEAAYDAKGYLVEGQLHHFYVVPGSTKKALTKTGAELLADLFRLRRASSKVTHSVETVEYVSARVSCELVDEYSRPAGSHEAACSTAEPGFRSPGARKKYGAKGKWVGPRGQGEWEESAPPDFRAALNDVVSRAGKRAFVGAVIVGTATDEIFEVAANVDANGEERTKPEAHVRSKEAQRTRDPEAAPAPPAPKPLTIAGKPLSALTTAQLETAAKMLTKMPDHQWDRHRTAVSEELEKRRQVDAFPQVLDDNSGDLPLGD